MSNSTHPSFHQTDINFFSPIMQKLYAGAGGAPGGFPGGAPGGFPGGGGAPGGGEDGPSVEEVD